MKEGIGFLTPKEAGKFLRVDKRTIYRWASEGKMPCRRAGKQWRFSKDELDQWSKKEYPHSAILRPSAEGISLTIKRGCLIVRGCR